MLKQWARSQHRCTGIGSVHTFEERHEIGDDVDLELSFTRELLWSHCTFRE
jgi:hypothetical protein